MKRFSDAWGELTAGKRLTNMHLHVYSNCVKCLNNETRVVIKALFLLMRLNSVEVNSVKVVLWRKSYNMFVIDID